MIGQIISHYRILNELGKGAMGIVYLAEDTRLGRKVAIKIAGEAQNDAQFRDRFLREARIAASLNHKNIATIHDCNLTENGLPYIVMELLQGQTLSEHLKSGDLPLIRQVAIIEEVLEALAEAHRHSIIHRDIKPGNVFITERNDVKVLDFGLAKYFKTAQPCEVDLFAQTIAKSETHAGTVLGTPQYMSPEQAKGDSLEADVRSDLFSLGTMLYECLTNRLPFPGKTMTEIAGKIQFVDPDPPSQLNPQLSEELDRITLKALAKSPDDRYQTSDAFLTELKAERARISDYDLAAIQLPVVGEIKTGATVEVKPPATKATKVDTVRRPHWTWLISIFALGIGYFVLSPVLRWWPFQPKLHEPTPEVKQLYQEGIFALRDGKFHKAAESLERVIKLDDKFELAHARLAEAYMELEYNGKAAFELAQIPRLIPNQDKLPELEGLYIKAVLNTASRRFSEAIENYEIIERLTPQAEKLTVYFDLGRAYERNQQADQAIEQYRKAHQIDGRYAPAHLRLGILYGQKNELDTAKASFKSAEENYRATGNGEGEALVYLWRGLVFDERNLLSEAHDNLNVALEKASTLNLTPLLIMTRIQRSSVYISEGKLIEAKREVDDAIELAKKENLKNIITSGLIKLADSYHARSDYQTAERYYIQARELAAESEGLYNKAMAQTNLGSLFIAQWRLDEGLKEVKEAREFFEKNSYSRQALGALLVIARAQRKKGDYLTALQSYEEQRQLAVKLNDRVMEARAIFGTAQILDDQDQFPKAFKLYEQSGGLYQSSGLQINVFYALHNQASLAWQIGDYQTARSLRDQAAASAQRLDDKASHVVTKIMIPLLDARIALSELNLDLARVKSQEALRSLDESRPEELISAKCTQCLAVAMSGIARAGSIDCREAVAQARKTKGDRLIAEANLALSQSLIERGDWQIAQDAARQAQITFSKLNKLESEWRAWLVMARASWLGRDLPQAKEAALQTESTLMKLKQVWDEQTYRQYLTRKDIRRQLDQLHKLSAAR